MFIISNQQITAGFNAEGAELCSLHANGNKQELIWQADTAFWGRHAPILFPIVGKLWKDEYKIDGKNYKLPQHGFARDATFKLEKQESNKVSFITEWSEDTLAKYPFKFLLRVIYEVKENTLHITYHVENKDSQAILFSIGAHPAFNCPVLPSEKRSDYMLEFSQSEDAEKHLLENGTFNGETEQMLNHTNQLLITDELFDADALVFKYLSSKSVELKNASGKSILTFYFDGFPYLGIWSKNQKSPFVCIEPWQGIADKSGFERDFSEKEGVISLPIGEMHTCEYAIQVG